jgi:hypothetical protein
VNRHHLTPCCFATFLAGAILASATMAGESTGLVRADPNKPNTSPAARQDAIDSIPMDRLAPAGRARAVWVLENTSVFRRLPIRVIPCDPDLYLFLVQHPDVVVNIWELFGASHLTVRQTGADVYQVTDDAGTSGTLQFLYRSRDLHVAYIDGTYTGKVFGHQVRGRGIIVLRSAYIRDSGGRSFVTTRLDAFMNIEPGGAEFLTKTFQPLVGKVADLNFIQTADFMGSLSRTAEVNQRGMQRLASRLAKVPPEVRQQFAELTGQVYQRAAKSNRTASRPAERPESEPPPEDVPLTASRPSDVK